MKKEKEGGMKRWTEVKGERRTEREKIEWEEKRENFVCICMLIVNK